MKNKGRWIVLCAIGYLVMLGWFWYNMPSMPTLSDLVAQTVLVSDEQIHSSGVILDCRRVLTAGHAAYCAPSIPREGLTVTDSAGDEHQVVGCIVDPNTDIAILYVSPPLPSVGTLLSTEDVHTGDAIVIIGTPIKREWTGCVIFGHVIRSPVDANYPGCPPWPKAMLYDGHTVRGCSGGPVYHDGRLVGIHVGGDGGIAIAIPISAFRGLLSK